MAGSSQLVAGVGVGDRQREGGNPDRNQDDIEHGGFLSGFWLGRARKVDLNGIGNRGRRRTLGIGIT
jgi:hypothetical protein